MQINQKKLQIDGKSKKVDKKIQKISSLNELFVL